MSGKGKLRKELRAFPLVHVHYFAYEGDLTGRTSYTLLGAYHKIEKGYRVMLSGSYGMTYGSKFETVRNYPDLKIFNMLPLRKQDWQRLNTLMGVWANNERRRWLCANAPFPWETAVTRMPGEEEYRLHYPREYAEDVLQQTHLENELRGISS